MLLGRSGCFPARQRRDERRVGLCRRQVKRRANTRSSEPVRRDMRNRFASRSIRARSATAVSCRFTFPWRSIRRSSIARGRIPARNTARRFSLPTQSKRRSRPPTSRQLNAAHAFSKPIVTTVEPGRNFYAAEDYHQNFLALNPTYPYIVINDLPKVENLKRLFPGRLSCRPGSRRRREAVELSLTGSTQP